MSDPPASGPARRRARVDGMRPLSGALDDVLAALAAPSHSSAEPASASTVGGVFARWADAVGPQIADHARPVRLEGATLYVEVDEPGWATQLRFLEADLVARIRTAAGAGVDSIEFRVRRR